MSLVGRAMGSPDFAAFERYAQELTETLQQDIQRRREAVKLGRGGMYVEYRISRNKETVYYII